MLKRKNNLYLNILSNKKCIVVGLRINGIGVVRALAREGIEVLAIDDNFDTAFGATKYAKKIKCPNVNDESLIDTLCNIGKEFSEKNVLILTLDKSVELVSEYREGLEKYYIFNLPDKDIIKKLTTKSTLYDYVSQLGLNVPKTYYINDVSLLNNYLNEITYPCIFKPNTKNPEFAGRFPKAFLIKDKQELISIYEKIPYNEAIIQEWIPGPDTNLIFCLYYFNANSEPLVWFTGRKIRQYIPYCGTGCYVEPYKDEYVKDMGIEFFKTINYKGFAAIEFKIDARDGSYKLMEPTVGRTEHLFALAVANGVNIPYIGYCDMAGIKLPKYNPNSKNIKFIYWSRDFKAAKYYIKQNELTIFQWLKSLRGKKAYALFAWDDLGPVTYKIKQKFYGGFKRIRRSYYTGKLSIFRIFHNYEAYKEKIKDILGIKYPVSSNKEHILFALDWLLNAQKQTVDGGIPRGYNLKDQEKAPYIIRKKGWEASYPETTGYIIPTLFDCYYRFKDIKLKISAIKMADWLCNIALPNGGFPGGGIDENQTIPVIFNTGQIIIGLCRAYKETKDKKYLKIAQKAGDFLIKNQEKNGAWRKFVSLNFYKPRSYDTKTAWALLILYEITKNEKYKRAAIKNLNFTLNYQLENGWFKNSDLRAKNDYQPLLHSIAYTIQGFLESGILLNSQQYINAAKLAADALLINQKTDGSLYARFNSDWHPIVKWFCLTGIAQTSLIWLRLYEITKEKKYLKAAIKANNFLKSTQNRKSKNLGIKGGIKGSLPIHASYCRYQYISWGTKFFIDTLLLEEKLKQK